MERGEREGSRRRENVVALTRPRAIATRREERAERIAKKVSSRRKRGIDKERREGKR